MKSRDMILILTLFLQVYVSHQYPTFLNKPVQTNGASFDYYSNQPSQSASSLSTSWYHPNNGNAERFSASSNSPMTINLLNPMNMRQTGNNIDGSEKPQSLFSFIDQGRLPKPISNNQNANSMNTMNIPSSGPFLNIRGDYVLPDYNQFYGEYFMPVYEPQLSPYLGYSDNSYIDAVNPAFFSTPVFNSMNSLISPFKSTTIPNKDISSSDDYLYNMSLDSIFKQAAASNGSGNKKVFKTNFGGDLSKCDMVCKCRDIYPNVPAPSDPGSGPFSPTNKLPNQVN